MLFKRYFGYQLEAVGQTNPHRLGSRAGESGLQGSAQAVIITASVAEAAAPPVKGQSGHEDDLRPAASPSCLRDGAGKCSTPGWRLHDPVGSRDKLIPGAYLVKA